jgi:hypothetical protein
MGANRVGRYRGGPGYPESARQPLGPPDWPPYPRLPAWGRLAAYGGRYRPTGLHGWGLAHLARYLGPSAHDDGPSGPSRIGLQRYGGARLGLPGYRATGPSLTPGNGVAWLRIWPSKRIIGIATMQMEGM